MQLPIHRQGLVAEREGAGAVAERGDGGRVGVQSPSLAAAVTDLAEDLQGLGLDVRSLVLRI